MKEVSFIRKEAKSPLLVKNMNEVPYLAFPELEKLEMIKHGFSTRLGGVSKAHLSSMNLGFSRGDDKDAVLENYRRITKAIGVDYEGLVLSHQTHTTNIKLVTIEDRGKGILKPRDFTDIDGLITNVPGITLVTFYADCVPILFVDPVKKVIASSHSGWRGTVKKIGKHTVERMKAEYGCNPRDLIVGIGPSICKDCYEVSEEVIEAFHAEFQTNLCETFYDKKENGKYQLDLWEANRLILEEAGVLRENISTTDICTCCNGNLMFSHRASQGLRGNLAAFLSIRE